MFGFPLLKDLNDLQANIMNNNIQSQSRLNRKSKRIIVNDLKPNNQRLQQDIKEFREKDLFNYLKWCKENKTINSDALNEKFGNEKTDIFFKSIRVEADAEISFFRIRVDDHWVVLNDYVYILYPSIFANPELLLNEKDISKYKDIFQKITFIQNSFTELLELYQNPFYLKKLNKFELLNLKRDLKLFNFNQSYNAPLEMQKNTFIETLQGASKSVEASPNLEKSDDLISRLKHYLSYR